MNVVKTKSEVHMTYDEYCTIRKFVDLLVEKACLNDEQVGHVVMGIYADDLDREATILPDVPVESDDNTIKMVETVCCKDCAYYSIKNAVTGIVCKQCEHASKFRPRFD